jgi:hypothetical protein
MAKLLPGDCSALGAAVIVGRPAPKSAKETPGAGIATLAFQRQSDFILLNPQLHSMYNAGIDAHHSSMQSAPADAQTQQLALLCVYAHPSESPDSTCPVAGVLQLLLRLPAAAPASSCIYPLDGSDGCAAQLPVALTPSQLFCMRTLASTVVANIILCCLQLPEVDSESSSPLLPDGARPQRGVSLISLAEDVFALDAAPQPRTSPALQRPAKAVTASLRHDAASAGALAPPKQRVLPRRTKSPVAAQEFSAELSLRAQLQASPRSPSAASPPPASASSGRGAAQLRQRSDGRVSPGSGLLYVQDNEARSRRPQHSFLIPMCDSDQD